MLMLAVRKLHAYVCVHICFTLSYICTVHVGGAFNTLKHAKVNKHLFEIFPNICGVAVTIWPIYGVYIWPWPVSANRVHMAIYFSCSTVVKAAVNMLVRKIDLICIWRLGRQDLRAINKGRNNFWIDRRPVRRGRRKSIGYRQDSINETNRKVMENKWN